MHSNKEFLINCRRDWVELYNAIIKEFRQIHFLLNTGAGAALLTYVLSHPKDVNCWLKIACIFFLIGIVFSIIAYLWETIFFLRKLFHFDKNYLPQSGESDDSIRKKVNNYIQYQEKTEKSDKNSALCRGLWGILCYILFLLGVFALIKSL